MTVVGLHPEELFDKLLDGELTPAERERLRQHLDGCEVCRFEYAARLDFQAEALQLQASSPPSAAHLPLRPPMVAGEERTTPVPAAAAPRRRRPRTLIWGLAAAALITTGGAVASVLAGHAPWHTLGALFSQTSSQQVAPATPSMKPASAPLVAAPVVAVAPAQAAVPVAVAAPAAVAALAVSEPVTKATPHHGALARVQVAPPTEAPATVLTTLPARAELPLVKEAVKEPTKEPSSAAKLFGEANQARRSGDIGRAAGLYHLLQDQFPGSPEADLSRVTLALLLLDSGDAKGALSGFERYLAGSSRGLEAEALVGRARALGRLGRRDQEAVAWREVQRKYPRSIYGRQANERLAALGQP
ncbi:MAG TPA: zf-HC2 domain-containing protein [Polyangiaceae bacterium]|nr:zf-HC2 domain-containing protein [Polyangiaceae bacterium]